MHPHLYQKQKFPGQINWTFFDPFFDPWRRMKLQHTHTKILKSSIESRTRRKHIIKGSSIEVIEQKILKAIFQFCFFFFAKIFILKLAELKLFLYFAFDPTKSHFKILFAVNSSIAKGEKKSLLSGTLIFSFLHSTKNKINLKSDYYK